MSARHLINKVVAENMEGATFMQATEPLSQPASQSSWAQKISWFLLPPVTAFVIVTVLLAWVTTGYQQQHQDKIYTGVTVWGHDLSRMTVAEAEAALAQAFPYASEKAITLLVPGTDEVWELSPAELGIKFDVAKTVAAAYQIGRETDGFRTQLRAWYQGIPVAPVIIFDEAQLDGVLNEIAAAINQPPQDASLFYNGSEVDYTPATYGRILDVADTRERLLIQLDL
jgi:hypothetical protein